MSAFLILDDNASERQIMTHLLGAAFPGADIRETDDADAAMFLCEQHPFDCILLDYNMPRVDGVSFTAGLRAKRPHLPVVLVTGFGDEMLVSHAIRHGVTDYIPKARINLDSIQRTVDRAIQSCAQARTIAEQREELENFAYALAHDFKQPIRQIRTFSQILTDELGAPQTDDVRQHLAFLDHAARRLGNLVDVMSQYTLLNQPPEIAPTPLDGVLANVRESLGQYLEERRAELISECGGLAVEGNEVLLGQVLQNLVINGLKYNKSATPRVAITAETQGPQCLIAIADNGIGMEPQYLSEIFRPLIRLHPASEYDGTGLGLTLARKAILAQKGAIWCQSEPGAGSTFFLKLPLALPN